MNITEYNTLLAAGGEPLHIAGSMPGDPDSVLSWNFGVVPPTPKTIMATGAATLYEVFPKIKGKWDGKTTVNHHDAVRKVLGKNLPAQYQRRGTCGGRGGSRGAEILQCVLIATGKRAHFKPVSHAWLYYLARREYDMLGGGDGVAGGSIPPMLEKYGALNREECGDTDYNSPNTDDIAVSWGGGSLDRTTAAKYIQEASDNVVTARLRVKSAQELADGIAAGGVGIGSDSQGYTMTRDSEGVCGPSGSWSHYHARSGIRLMPSSRKVFQYDQSWGDTLPSGPLLAGCPGNVFGVEWSVQDSCCRNGEWDVVFGFDLWDIENDKIDLDWIFTR